ncbi:MAG: MerR family transcriptional regulator [Prevotella sp.]|jgi:DNA-binding transcriptional MerR regulator
MALNKDKNIKLYYSIKEVAKIIGVNESTLRYWETEFPSLKPKTVATNKVRQYTEKDIDQIKVIYNLIKVRGFKIAAARKYLHANGDNADKSTEILERLTHVREELKSMKKQLDMLE